MFFANWRRKRRERKEFKKALKKIDQHMRDGKKVNAIKAYRRATGLGLKESRAYVDDRYPNVRLS